jgi:hypothetical protein
MKLRKSDFSRPPMVVGCFTMLLLLPLWILLLPVSVLRNALSSLPKA